MLLFVKVIVALLWTLMTCSGETHIHQWATETNNSLKLNVKGKCKLQFEPGLSMPKNPDTFSVNIIYPSKSDLHTFQNLPVTLTKANAQVAINAHQQQYNWSIKHETDFTVPSDHVAQNRTNCYGLSMLAAKEGVLDLYQNFKSVHRTFFMLRNRNAVVHPFGSVMVDCGYYQGLEGCETRWGDLLRKWDLNCKIQLTAAKLTVSDLFSTNHTIQTAAADILYKCSYYYDLDKHETLNKTGLYDVKYYKRVFVITALWDFNYHHFIADSMARMARHIKFLRTETDVMIHIRAFENYDVNPVRSDSFRQGAKQMRDKLMAILGIDPSRLIFGLVVAEEVYIPRNTHCAYALDNPIELRILAKELLNGVSKHVSVSGSNSHNKHQHHRHNSVNFNNVRKNLIIQHRYTPFGSNERNWHNDTFNAVVADFSVMYPDHNIVLMVSTAASAPDYCLACDIREYANADILVGLHGAGLTNLMFMPPNSLIVELTADYKNVNMPYCGYYGSFSAIFGQHHYLHAYNFQLREPIKSDVAARKTREFYDQIQKQDFVALNVTKIVSEDMKLPW